MYLRLTESIEDSHDRHLDDRRVQLGQDIGIQAASEGRHAIPNLTGFRGAENSATAASTAVDFWSVKRESETEACVPWLFVASYGSSSRSSSRNEDRLTQGRRGGHCSPFDSIAFGSSSIYMLAIVASIRWWTRWV